MGGMKASANRERPKTDRNHQTHVQSSAEQREGANPGRKKRKTTIADIRQIMNLNDNDDSDDGNERDVRNVRDDFGQEEEDDEQDDDDNDDDDDDDDDDAQDDGRPGPRSNRIVLEPPLDPNSKRTKMKEIEDKEEREKHKSSRKEDQTAGGGERPSLYDLMVSSEVAKEDEDVEDTNGEDADEGSDNVILLTSQDADDDDDDGESESGNASAAEGAGIFLDVVGDGASSGGRLDIEKVGELDVDEVAEDAEDTEKDADISFLDEGEARRAAAKASKAFEELNIGRIPGHKISRYFGGGSVRCYNCKSLGHTAAECNREKLCYLCAYRGHESSSCPDQICPNCLYPNARNHVCKAELDILKLCYRCGLEGHEDRDCQSRRTSVLLRCMICREFGHVNCAEDPIKEYSKGATSPAGCMNCGHPGHSYRMCKQPKYHMPLNVPNANRYNPLNRKINMLCFTCNRSGHKSVDCPDGPTCFRCNKSGHFIKDCPQLRLERGKGVHCYVCNGNNHTASQCFSRHRERHKEKASRKSKKGSIPARSRRGKRKSDLGDKRKAADPKNDVYKNFNTDRRKTRNYSKNNDNARRNGPDNRGQASRSRKRTRRNRRETEAGSNDFEGTHSKKSKKRKKKKKNRD